MPFVSGGDVLWLQIEWAVVCAAFIDFRCCQPLKNWGSRSLAGMANAHDFKGAQGMITTQRLKVPESAGDTKPDGGASRTCQHAI